jgi:hypothetical protein
MGDRDVKLNPLSETEVNLMRIHPEWRIDPAILLRFKEEIWKAIVRTRIEFLAEKAKLDARAMELEAEMYKKMAATIGR